MGADPLAVIQSGKYLRLLVLCLATALAAPVLSAHILADSTKDFSGTQGFRNWYYGYFANGDPHFFTMLPSFNSQTQMFRSKSATSMKKSTAYILTKQIYIQQPVKVP